jgi:RHH-type proline utilization regulon transcriptional repressor/proline dehydrogenase/delta 1-pyrroline-5-carboxylate dehydrogenase
VAYKKPFAIALNDQQAPDPSAVIQALKAIPKWQSAPIDSRLSIIGKALSQQNWTDFFTAIETIARQKLAQPMQLPGPTGEDNKLSLHGRGIMLLLVTDGDSSSKAEQQIATALLCGCPLIVCADTSHRRSLEAIQLAYNAAGLDKRLLQIEPLEHLSGLLQHSSIEGLVANSLNTDSSALRQIMAQRTGSIIPLIEWPENNQSFTYHWLLWFLSERTRTENLVARGGNTQLFNLPE